MDEKISKRVDQYMELLENLKQRTGSELTALNLLQEICKDRRMDEIRQEREAKGSEQATDKQKNFLKKLGLKCPISREQALVLLCQKHIEELLRIWKTELCPGCLLEDFGFTLDWGKLDKFAAGLGRNNPTRKA